MGTTWVIILLSVAAVGLFVLGMSLTLIFKGHHIKSEISENEHMQARGIKCAVQQMREEERGGGDCTPGLPDCPPTGCAGCETGTHG